MNRKAGSEGGKAVAKYLARHAEPKAAAALGLAGEFGPAIVGPAYGEEQSLFTTLGSVTAGPGGDIPRVPGLRARADSPPGGDSPAGAAPGRLPSGRAPPLAVP